MRKLVLGLLGASALAISSAASAVVILPGAPLPPNDPSTVFITSPNPVLPTYTGPITATIGHTGIPGVLSGTSFSDTFLFTIGTTGVGLVGMGIGTITTGVTSRPAHPLPPADHHHRADLMQKPRAHHLAHESRVGVLDREKPWGSGISSALRMSRWRDVVSMRCYTSPAVPWK